MNTKLKEEIEKLKQEGKKIYSFSKLGTFYNCQYEFYKTYIEKERGIDNCYTILGSCLHKNIEAMYDGTGTIESFKDNYAEKLVELEMLGYDFPNEKIKNSWIADVNHFVNNFKKLDTKMIIEKLVLFKVTDDIYLQGYIDAIVPSEKGKPYVNIIDWKTSSKFAGKKLPEAGRQLLMYKVGLEDNTNLKVDKLMWCMIKYINVCSMQKNGKVKKKMCNRGKWVKEMKDQLEKEMYKLNIDEFEVELLLDKSVEDNNILGLPKEIQDKYWLEDCFVEYEPTEDKLDELKQYVINTVAAIESKDPSNENDWTSVEDTDSFYCNVLCGHRNTCPRRKKYLEQNADKFEKKDKKDEFDLFG